MKLETVLLVMALPVLTACASAGPGAQDLTPVLPAAEARLDTAPPEARDALEAGLSWIEDDAPDTEVEGESRP